MAKKLILSVLLGASSLLGVAQVVHADATTVNYTSHGYIEYYKNTDVIPPVDPTHPTDPLDPIDPTEPGTAGPLSIDYASNINFDKQKISGKDEVYYAELNHMTDKNGKEIETPDYIQVTDDRGTDSGWKLTASEATPMMSGKNELKGTVITLTHGTATGENNVSMKPTAAKTVAIAAGGDESTVLTATENHGMGTWEDSFGTSNEDAKTSISIAVPAATKKVAGFYKTDLTWTLTDSAL
ncbi:WxL domain-containing protein [Dellaglioa sp. BT-FLS60]